MRGMAAAPGRRAVLAGAGALAVSACLPYDRDDRDVLASAQARLIRHRSRLAEESRALAASYRDVLARFPDARDRLEPLAAEHADHARALLPPHAARWLRRVTSTPAPSAGDRNSGATPSSAPPTALPTTMSAALQELRRRERAATRRRSRQAGREADPQLARLLASIAASNAVHAELLRPPA